MAKINLMGVFVGGIVAGIVINVFEFVLNGIILANQWPAIMSSLNRPNLGMHQIIAFNVLGFVMGFAAVWTYAAIRPRFGAGPRTALAAALLTWVTAYILVDAMPTIMGVFPMQVTLLLISAGFVEIIVATLAGAYFYKEA